MEDMLYNQNGILWLWQENTTKAIDQRITNKIKPKTNESRLGIPPSNGVRIKSNKYATGFNFKINDSDPTHRDRQVTGEIKKTTVVIAVIIGGKSLKRVPRKEIIRLRADKFAVTNKNPGRANKV
jgi:hypothetical protein